MKELLDQMRAAVLDGEEEKAVALAEQALADKLDLKTVMDEGFLKGIQEAGKLFADGEYYLPDLVCSADAMKSALAVLDEELKRPTSGFESKGKVIVTTVQGDVHDIGKIIVGAMLTAVGYEVHDLGVDVPNENVLAAIDEIKPDVVGLSALLTTTMVEQKNIIEALKAAGKRNDAKVIVGGAPVTHAWAGKIGADGYSDDAISAVTLVNNLLA
ncbi:MAG TPA: corrinoid protein [Anaerovoracaceae bacterium]|nr:corrinoid protein [Anaerovoracaceae bacterium]